MGVQSDADRHEDTSAYHWFSTKQVIKIIFASFLTGAIFGWISLAIGVYTPTYPNFLLSISNFLWIHYWVTPSTIGISLFIIYIAKFRKKKPKSLEVKTKQ